MTHAKMLEVESRVSRFACGLDGNGEISRPKADSFQEFKPFVSFES